MKPRFLLFACIIGISSICMASEEKMLERRFTLSSGYAEKFFDSNEGLVYFPLSVIQGYSKLFDVTTHSFEHWGARLGAVLVDLPISFWLANSLFVPFHEFGHARFAAARGWSYTYGTRGYGTEWQGLSNYWTLSLMRLITPPFFFPGSGIAYCRYESAEDSLAPALEKYWGSNGAKLVSSASGLNNQMFLAKHIARDIYERNGHMTYFQHYLGNKLSGFVYAIFDQDQNPHNDPMVQNNNDIKAILEGYAAKNYGVTHTDIKMQSLLSLLSGTTFSLGRAYYDYFAHHSPVARPAEFFGVRVPDLNSYINARGLSFEIESDYRIFSFLSVGLAYEFIYKGEFTQEFRPRARYDLAHAWPQLNEFWISTDLVIGAKGVGGSLMLNYAPWSLNELKLYSRLGFFASMNIYNAMTLYGERNTVSITNQKIVAPEGIFGLHVRY